MCLSQKSLLWIRHFMKQNKTNVFVGKGRSGLGHILHVFGRKVLCFVFAFCIAAARRAACRERK